MYDFNNATSDWRITQPSRSLKQPYLLLLTHNVLHDELYLIEDWSPVYQS